MGLIEKQLAACFYIKKEFLYLMRISMYSVETVHTYWCKGEKEGILRETHARKTLPQYICSLIFPQISCCAIYLTSWTPLQPISCTTLSPWDASATHQEDKKKRIPGHHLRIKLRVYLVCVIMLNLLLRRNGTNLSLWLYVSMCSCASKCGMCVCACTRVHVCTEMLNKAASNDKVWAFSRKGKHQKKCSLF